MAGRCREPTPVGSARLRRCTLELVDEVGRVLGSGLAGHGLRHGQVHLDGHQLLLGSIVEVTLEAAALVILGADQALARGPQLGDMVQELGGEANVAQNQASSRSDIGETSANNA